MNKIALFDTATGSNNIGDEIIMEAVRKIILEIFPETFVVSVPTHLRSSWDAVRSMRGAKLAIVGGTNLLSTDRRRYRQWKLDLVHALRTPPCVLLGVGWWQYQENISPTTRLFYKSVFSKDHIHSVRDNYTKQKLSDQIGLRCVNTGCPTIWTLTAKHVAAIPEQRSSRVVFTFTDYNKDPQLDRGLVAQLRSIYSELLFWPQGARDIEYIQDLDLGDVKIIPPNLNSYDDVLKSGNIDYIGTRLHGGIRALQHQRRAIILAVDNRSIEMGQDFCLPVFPRKEMDSFLQYEDRIIAKQINIPLKEIEQWKMQFCKYHFN